MARLRIALILVLLACAFAVTAATPMVSAGALHTCAVDSQGAAYCWGDNFAGQIGDGVIAAALKFDVTGLPANIAAIGAGSAHACASSTSGLPYCWGDNEAGQLGDGTNTSRSSAGAVSNLAAVREWALGLGHSCALTVAGSVRCWGLNSSGQLGDGTTQLRTTPVTVAGLASGATAIVSGDNHACAITAAGGVKCWGRNDRGQLGDGTTTQRTSPVDVPGLASVVAIAAGASNTCAADSAGVVRCWGANDGAELGDGTTAQRTLPVAVVGLNAAARRLAMAYRRSCALTAASAVRCWGTGVDAGNTNVAPSDIAGLSSGVADIAAGQFHFCALGASGTMKCWGSSNVYGEIGDGTTNGAPNPVDVAGVPAGVHGMALGSAFTCALLAANTVRCWGNNFYGELGANNPKEYNFASRVTGLTSVATISGGRAHTCALVAGGVAKCWGGNGHGELGDGTTTNRGTPGDVVGLGSGIRNVQAGDYYSCAVTGGGGVKCWGSGQTAPLDVPGLASGVVSLALGFSHSCALTAAGGVKCWGNNASGQLGDGTNVSRSTAVDVVGLQSGVASISAGSAHTCALLASGRLKCWGGNDFGQIGDGTTTSRNAPVDVAAPIGAFQAIAARSTETCGITRTRKAWCWGYAAEQFVAAPRSQPTLVTQLATEVEAVDGGDAHVCALLDGGGVNCFGQNNTGQLGDGSKVLVRRLPQAVVGPDGRTFLDLTPEDALAQDKLPPFVMTTAGTGVNVTANVQFRSQDVGRSASVFVFAIAPQNMVQSLPASEPAMRVGMTKADTPLPCVLAQLNTSGQLVGVSASSLQAYVTGVLTSQGQAVTVINGVPTANIGGTTFYVGYGTSGSTMLNGGTNRSVVSVGTPACDPQPPQTGWWWNPAESGRGFSIEENGNNMFFAAFLYDVSGRASWYVATGPASLDGSLFQAELLSAKGGQTLGGAYPGSPALANEGPITLAFNDASHGTLVWPGGTVPIERFNIVPNGLNLLPQAGLPERGWWWNPVESGRGFFLEWQGGVLDIAGYMYDDAGSPVWYLTEGATPDPLAVASSWWQYANGQTLTGPYKPPTQTSNSVAPVTIQFQGAENAIMTLPGGKTTALTRFRF